MPSPFPGMDPFLESPREFEEFYGGFTYNLMAFLQKALPSNYFADLGEKSSRDVEPWHDQADHAESIRKRLAPGAKPTLVRAYDVEVVERFVQITGTQDQLERTATVVQVLTRHNKRPGSASREVYLTQLDHLLRARINLVEIDLLRDGLHATAVDRNRAIERAGHFDYHVCVRRASRPGAFEVYPIRVRDRLPVLSVPLLPGDRDVALDLQAAFDQSYDDGPHERRIEYQLSQTDPPLSLEDAAWVAERLKAAGK